jgi:hypothetical protein
VETKVCSKCGIERNIIEFRKDITKKDGLRPECKLCVKNYEMTQRVNNPTLMSEKLKKFYKDNPEKRKEYRQNYKSRKHEQRKERRNSDPVFNLVNRVRCRIWKFLTLSNITKKNKTFEIVGCTPEFLKEYLEKQFKDGMSWENRHLFHIDHIIPLSSAKTEKEIYKLCHYTNLQPLWVDENLKKSNKIVEPFK